MRPLHSGIWEYRVGRSFEAEDRRDEGFTPVKFFDRSTVRNFLLDSIHESAGFAEHRLRSLAYDLGMEPHRLSNHDLVDRLACEIQSGLVVVVARREPSCHVVLPPPKEPTRRIPEPVREKRVFVIRLETDSGVAIPQARFEAQLSSGERREGTLDVRGEAVLVDPPPGPIIVTYPDREDVSAKALAAAARRGFDGPDHGPVYDLLHRAPTAVKKAIASYDNFFNDYTGHGFVEDTRAVFTDPDAWRVVECLLARAGVAVPDPPTYVEWRGQDLA